MVSTTYLHSKMTHVIFHRVLLIADLLTIFVNHLKIRQLFPLGIHLRKAITKTCLRFVVQTRIKIRVRIQIRRAVFFLAVKIVHGKIGNCLDNNWRNLSTSKVVYMSSIFRLWAIGSRNLSQNACKSEKIHKMTTIFIQNDNLVPL
jgi:hypothetical protein